MSQKRAKKERKEKKRLAQIDDTNHRAMAEKLGMMRPENYPLMQTEKIIPDKPTGSVYKFFTNKSYAEDFVQGNSIKLGTLKEFRADENAERGDSEEGYETYFTGDLVGSSDDVAFVEQARRAGIMIGPGCGRGTIRNCSNKIIIPDAYILCTTTNYSEDMKEVFGNYCVEITQPEEFFHAVSTKLESQLAVKTSTYGLVTYTDRVYTKLESRPGAIGFVKPSHPYASQKECRFFWLPQNFNSIKSLFLECKEIKGMCHLI